MVFAHKSFVLAWLTQCLGQSINLVAGPKTQTYRAHRLLYGKVGHSTVLHVTICVCTHF